MIGVIWDDTIGENFYGGHDTNVYSYISRWYLNLFYCILYGQSQSENTFRKIYLFCCWSFNFVFLSKVIIKLKSGLSVVQKQQPPFSLIN